jgi:glycosyltransferase involved in cell wall biosynthesis
MAGVLQTMGHDVEIITTDDDGPAGRRVTGPFGEREQSGGLAVRWFPRQTRIYKVSMPLARWLKKHVREFHIVHIHALFSFSSVAAARAARRAGVPYIIRPLGVLNHWGMRHRRPWLKRLSLRFLDGPALRHASAIHYTAEAERVEAEESAGAGSGAVIPPGIPCEEFERLPPAAAFARNHPRAAGRPVILFLSRLDAKKGIELLFAAFSKIRQRHRDALLVMAGDGDASYKRQLREEAGRHGIAEHIEWTGFLAGREKLNALAAATVFVLPSWSENFGIAAVEALAAGVPCVLTRGVAIAAEVSAAQAGIVVAPDAGQVARALDELLSDAALRASMAANGRRLAREKFSAAAMGRALEELYHHICPPHASCGHHAGNHHLQ